MPSPPRTPTGHHMTVHGRRWRASDPAIPLKLRQELVNVLMAGRRGVRSDSARGSIARRKVQDAKVALGERGVEWWVPAEESAERSARQSEAKCGEGGEAADEKAEEEGGTTQERKEQGGNLWWQLSSKQDGLHGRIDSTIRTLCRAREHGTVCPSEVSRAVAGDATEDWRELMPLVRERAEGLVRKGQIEICQKGERVEPGEYKGPIRLRVAAGIDELDKGRGSESGKEDVDHREGKAEGDGDGDGVEKNGQGSTARRNQENKKANEKKDPKQGSKRHHTPDPKEDEPDSLPLRSGKRRR